ncbi:hypothetical protein PR048_027293 [Dryococelus australis]|uniref:Uncharacterized protein n=1 Tax=Dryococelus australis TaxID=614101 RepID=A0ABQ9GF28_9NEOP|nr:hypothetical protein PR048_027293 [Dryococelus australis]
MEQRRNERAGGNVRSPRKPADNAKILQQPRRESNPVLLGWEASSLTTTPPRPIKKPVLRASYSQSANGYSHTKGPATPLLRCFLSYLRAPPTWRCFARLRPRSVEAIRVTSHAYQVPHRSYAQLPELAGSVLVMLGNTSSLNKAQKNYVIFILCILFYIVSAVTSLFSLLQLDTVCCANVMTKMGPRSCSGQITRLPPKRTWFDSGGGGDFRKWESCRTMPLVGEFSRVSPVSPRPCIPALHHTHLTSPSLFLKTSMFRAARIPSLTYFSLSLRYLCYDYNLWLSQTIGITSSHSTPSCIGFLRNYSSLYRDAPHLLDLPVLTSTMPDSGEGSEAAAPVGRWEEGVGESLPRALSGGNRRPPSQRMLRVCRCWTAADASTTSPETARTKQYRGETAAYDANSGGTGAAVAERLACLSPTKANRVPSPAGTMLLVGGFSRGSPISPALSPRHGSMTTSITSSALNTSLLRAAQISSLTILNRQNGVTVPLMWACTFSDRLLSALGTGFSSDWLPRGSKPSLLVGLHVGMSFPVVPIGEVCSGV